MRTYLLAFGVFAVFALALAASQKFFQISYINDLEQKASEALNNGNYLASLEGYIALKEEKDAAEADAKIAEAKKLLIAEEILARAKKAKDDGAWFAVKALLEDGGATTDTAFLEREEATALYLEAANKVKALEEKIEAELREFRQEAASEKARRETAEETVQEVTQEVTKVRRELETTIREKEQTTAELQFATSQKNVAEQVAARERVLKFLNELELYASMLVRADGYLGDAVSEIERGSDTTGFILLDKGRVLFEEVNVRAGDLLANRTEEQYKVEVQVLLQSGALFINASRSFKNAVVFIEKENQDATDKFAQYMNDGKSVRQEALRLLVATKEFISSSR